VGATGAGGSQSMRTCGSLFRERLDAAGAWRIAGTITGVVDKIEAASSFKINKLQQSSTSARHLFETKGTENE